MAKKLKERIFYIITMIFTCGFFTLLGERSYYEYSDSWQYIELTDNQGVMPLYQLFIHIHRMLLGEERFLYGVAFSQAIICILCVMGFTVWIRRRFCPQFLTWGLIWLVSLVPFTVDYPNVIISHAILTEALAYPLFYVLVILLIEAMLRRSYVLVAACTAMSVCMALVRTQMQICFVLTAAVLVYIVFRRCDGKGWKRKLICLLPAFLFGILVIGVGELALLNINRSLQQVKIGLRGENVLTSETVDAAELEDAIESDIPANEILEKSGSADSANITGQFGSVLIDRTFYEIDEEDVELFQDPEVRAFFLTLLENSNREKARYVYARKGLWKWKDIMGGVGGGTYVLQYAWEDYEEEFPESGLLDKKQATAMLIAVALLKVHWPRMIYHTLCMLPQGFICTVFFQVEAIYGLCHLYMLFIYLSAVVGIIWGLKKKEDFGSRGEFLLGAVTLNILMVVVTSTIFFGMQRYLIYGFGVFYAAYLLMLERMWKLYGKNIWNTLKRKI